MNVVTPEGLKVHAVTVVLWGSAITRCGLEVPDARRMARAAEGLDRPRWCRKCHPVRDRAAWKVLVRELAEDMELARLEAR